LAANTTFNAGKDSLITIEFEDEDRKRAAPITNAYIEELTRLTQVLAVTEAGQRRLFFERQLEKAKTNLAEAELALKSALDTRGVISVDSDSRAIVETVAKLRAQASAKEIQLNSMRAFMTPDNPEFKRIQQELISLRGELSKLQNGTNSGDIVDGAKNSGGLENIKILRDVKYHQMLYELLSKQYEVARLDEAKESSIIQVLDKAEEPERKSKPKRAIIVLLATAFAFVAVVVWAVMQEKNQSAEQKAKWQQLRSLLKFR
jgi:tyrosine-protein kinase Etk/Wzc